MEDKSATFPRVVEESKSNGQVEIDRFSMGALTGYEMALQVMQTKGWPGEFKMRDRVTIECTGVTPATIPGQSDMLNFNVEVD